jgi:hypothetical protein
MPGESAMSKPIGGLRFEVLCVLGAGGMGVVYEAIDRETQRKVALKTLRSLDAEAVLRFKDEFRSLQDIEHPNLVSLGELFEEDGQLFFTMELVQGTPFVEYVRKGATVEPPGARLSARPPPGAESASLAVSIVPARPPVEAIGQSSHPPARLRRCVRRPIAPRAG